MVSGIGEIASFNMVGRSRVLHEFAKQVEIYRRFRSPSKKSILLV
jgi:hypothetical protein